VRDLASGASILWRDQTRVHGLSRTSDAMQKRFLSGGRMAEKENNLLKI
jgi:hypothetical protein